MIYIHNILQRGTEHKLACQDSLTHFENEDYIFAGVFDGCSEIKDSHFASALLNKTFNKSFNNVLINKKEEAFNNIDEPESIKELSIEILDCFFRKLDTVRLELDLTVGDFSSTCILFFYSKYYQKGIVYVFGDGVLLLNENFIKIDHDNKPRYIIHFWKDLVNGKSKLCQFLETYEQIWEIDQIQNIVLSTDGILTFNNPEINDNTSAILELIESIEINGIEKVDQNSFFEKKYNILSFSKWKHTDDLGIVRIYNKK